MASELIKGETADSLISIFKAARRAKVEQMKRDGWDPSQTLAVQRAWIDREKRNKTKKIGIMLAYQLAELMKQINASQD